MQAGSMLSRCGLTILVSTVFSPSQSPIYLPIAMNQDKMQRTIGEIVRDYEARGELVPVPAPMMMRPPPGVRPPLMMPMGGRPPMMPMGAPQPQMMMMPMGAQPMHPGMMMAGPPLQPGVMGASAPMAYHPYPGQMLPTPPGFNPPGMPSTMSPPPMYPPGNPRPPHSAPWSQHQ